MQFYIDPAILTLGPLSIRYYGLVYAIAFLVLYVVMLKNKEKLFLTEEQCSELLLSTGLGLLLFGRLFHFLFDNPSYLLANPLKFFAVWEGGMAFYGSVIGLILGATLYLKWRKKSMRKTLPPLADIAVLVGAAALIFGRITNFINQELVGTPTNVSWCFHFFMGFTQTGQMVFDEVCRHPYQLYAAFSHIILFGILLWFYFKNKTRKNGETFWWFVILYGILRFIVDFWREDVRLILNITSWQMFSLVIVIIGLIFIWKIRIKKKKGAKHE